MNNEPHEPQNPVNLPAQPDNPTPPALPPALPPAPHQLESFPVVGLIALHFFTCGLFSLIWLNVLHGKLPRVRSNDPSAGKAIGFCFIPFFNLYWIFFTFRRLCLRIAEQREQYGLPPNDLRGLATADCIVKVIPWVNVLIGYTILTPIFIGRVQASVNELVATSATATPHAAASGVPPARGMPGWAIALVVCGCLVPVMLFFIGLLSALLLPALAGAQKKGQAINCVNNLKQVGLAFRVWDGDHGDQYPFNVSTNQGGTLEWCAVGADGLDLNSWRHFQVMSNELSTPIILHCPADQIHQPALDFTHFTAENVSYLVHSGANVSETNPEMVLAVCMIHNEVLLGDGSVMHVTKARMNEILASLKPPQTQAHP